MMVRTHPWSPKTPVLAGKKRACSGQAVVFLGLLDRAFLYVTQGIAIHARLKKHGYICRVRPEQARTCVSCKVS